MPETDDPSVAEIVTPFATNGAGFTVCDSMMLTLGELFASPR